MSVGQSFSFQDARQLMSDAKFYEGYSRFIPELNRYETWSEAVARVMNMHRKFFTQKGKMTDHLESLIQQAQESYERKEFLGAQRALQFGGDQLLKHHGKLYNCIGTPIDRFAAFGEIMYWGLCGCGVGYSVQLHHIAKLPRVVPRPKQAKIHVIQDSIEGWAEAVDVLLSSFFENGGKHPEFQGRKIYFDKSKIREKGSMISGGFLAPGPEPLMNALNKIENILIHVSEEKRQLKSIECYDIICHCFDSILSGGVRRAASICLFSLGDQDMMNAKVGNWYQVNPQRGRSNNSVLLKRSDTTFDQFKELIEKSRQFGEPGFYFADDENTLTNPCVEIGFWPYYEGESGSQGCNLVEINGSAPKTRDEFWKICENAAIMGTLQAAYTDFKFVSDVTKKIFDREALLGISITGWTENVELLFDEQTLKKGVDIIRETNKLVADMIGINPAARLTAVKPSGNSCTTFDTKIKTEFGEMPLYEIFQYCSNNLLDDLSIIGNDTGFQIAKQLNVYDMNNELKPVTGLYFNGIARIYEIEFEDDKIYKFTDHHKLLTKNGWKMVCDLTEEDEIESF